MRIIEITGDVRCLDAMSNEMKKHKVIWETIPRTYELEEWEIVNEQICCQKLNL